MSFIFHIIKFVLHFLNSFNVKNLNKNKKIAENIDVILKYK